MTRLLATVTQDLWWVGVEAPTRSSFPSSHLSRPLLSYPSLVLPLKGTHFLPPMWLSLLPFKYSQPSAPCLPGTRRDCMACPLWLGLSPHHWFGWGAGMPPALLQLLMWDHPEVSFQRGNQQHSRCSCSTTLNPWATAVSDASVSPDGGVMTAWNKPGLFSDTEIWLLFCSAAQSSQSGLLTEPFTWSHPSLTVCTLLSVVFISWGCFLLLRKIGELKLSIFVTITKLGCWHD